MNITVCRKPVLASTQPMTMEPSALPPRSVVTQPIKDLFMSLLLRPSIHRKTRCVLVSVAWSNVEYPCHL